jgi:excisionase family DNA binding protein
MVPADRITVAQAAEILGLSTHRVYELLAAGILPAERDGLSYLLAPAEVHGWRARRVLDVSPRAS